MDKKELEQLLNIVTDLSAEAVVSIDEEEPHVARKQLGELQGFVDAYVAKYKLRQVTEEDTDFNMYMNEAYSSLDRK